MCGGARHMQKWGKIACVRQPTLLLSLHGAAACRAPDGQLAMAVWICRAYPVMSSRYNPKQMAEHQGVHWNKWPNVKAFRLGVFAWRPSGHITYPVDLHCLIMVSKIGQGKKPDFCRLFAYLLSSHKILGYKGFLHRRHCLCSPSPAVGISHMLAYLPLLNPSIDSTDLQKPKKCFVKCCF